jgi:hypothetical protein
MLNLGGSKMQGLEWFFERLESVWAVGLGVAAGAFVSIGRELMRPGPKPMATFLGNAMFIPGNAIVAFVIVSRFSLNPSEAMLISATVASSNGLIFDRLRKSVIGRIDGLLDKLWGGKNEPS